MPPSSDHVTVIKRLTETRWLWINKYERAWLASVIRVQTPSAGQLVKLAKIRREVEDRRSGRYGFVHQRGYGK